MIPTRCGVALREAYPLHPKSLSKTVLLLPNLPTKAVNRGSSRSLRAAPWCDTWPRVIEMPIRRQGCLNWDSADRHGTIQSEQTEGEFAHWVQVKQWELVVLELVFEPMPQGALGSIIYP